MILGVDVSKATLDAAILPEAAAVKARHRVFANTESGRQQLMEWVRVEQSSTGDAGSVPVHACLEATGPYGDALARALHSAGYTVSLINPATVHAFAKSQLKRTKTDKADAELIARFCALQAPPLWSPPAAELEKLQALVRRIDSLEQMKQMEVNRLQVTSCEVVCHSLRDHIAYLEQQLEATRSQLEEHIKSEPALRDQARLLCSIPGIGEATAAVLLAELGTSQSFKSSRQVAAFAGLAPYVRESGSSVRGRPRLCKIGSPRLRKALYFPAITALHHNPVVVALGGRLAEKRKCKMLIVGAAMRKLLVLAYGVLKSGQPFDPHYAS